VCVFCNVLVMCILAFTVSIFVLCLLYCFVYVYVLLLILCVLPPSDNSVAISISSSNGQTPM
jgi:uncharacterized membrane-anchored protein YitT (DUF2179 family)